MALERLTRTSEFQKWHKIEVARRLGKFAAIEDDVRRAMMPENLLVEYYDPNIK